MEEKNSLLQYTTIFYSILTILGYEYLDKYYGHWGIEIYPFLDFSEILLLFLRNITSVMIVLSLSVYFFLFGNYYDFVYKFSSIKFNINERKLVQIIVIVSLLISVIGFYFKNETLILYNSILVYSMIFIFSFNKINIILERKGVKLSNEFSKILLIFFYLFLINISYSNYDYKMILNKEKVNIISFQYENRMINSNDSILFIGSTSKYIFLHNLKSKHNYIYEKSNIKNIVLKKKK